MGQYLRLNLNESVKLGSLTLPGVVTGIQVSGKLQIDEQDLENTNLTTVAVLGYTTQTVTVNLTLTGETQAAIDRQVAQVQRAFQVDRVKAAGAKLIPVRVVSPHLDARRVKVVVFDAFDSRESDDLEVQCTLSFHEFEADVARMQARVAAEAKGRAEEAKKKKAAEKGGAGGVASPPGGGKGAAGGSGGTDGSSKTGGTPSVLAGFQDGSAAARALAGGF